MAEERVRYIMSRCEKELAALVDKIDLAVKEGKVYLPQEATRALQHFFSKSNLSALRELALTRAAQAVSRAQAARASPSRSRLANRCARFGIKPSLLPTLPPIRLSPAA